MDYEELRPLTLLALKALISHKSLQLLYIINQTETFAHKKGFYGSSQPVRHQDDREKVRQIVWELILEGVLAIGLNENNPNFPFVSITEHGKKVLESGRMLPYDPDGYLKEIKDELPNLDPLIELYLSESLQAYLKGLMFSSAVMLGVASEKAFLLLFDSFTDALTLATKKRKFQRLQNSIRTKNKFDELKKEIIDIRRTIPSDLSADLESQFDGIFNLIRITRNDAGHPSGRIIKRGVAFINLQLFPMYCKRVYGLIDYFNKNLI